MDRQKGVSGGKAGVSLSHLNMGFGRREARRRRCSSRPVRLSAKRAYVFCHYCGYSPQSGRIDLACPKCNHHAWETGTIAARLVSQED
jgi:Zn finger protein HypA/HybF involved in hydrogenase expression